MDIVTGTIQIAKSSAKLWAAVEMGGESMRSTSIATTRQTGLLILKKNREIKIVNFKIVTTTALNQTK